MRAPIYNATSLLTLLLLHMGIGERYGLFVNGQCTNSSEALLKVSPILDDDGNFEYYGRPKLNPQIRVNPSVSAVSKGFSWDRPGKKLAWVGTWTTTNRHSFETCLPRDIACGHIEVEGPPQSDFEVSWDGQILEKGPEVLGRVNHNFTAVEFGEGCMPQCAADEGLYEAQYRRIGGYNYNGRSGRVDLEDCRVEDLSGNIITSYNDKLPDSENLWVDRKCLPKNDCYRFLMSNKYHPSDHNIFGEHASISFDGETLFDEHAWYYETFEFGNDCKSRNAKEEESTVELFISDAPEGEFSSWSWEMLMYNEKGDPEVFQSGKSSSNSDSTLHYNKMMVPKNSCMTFSFKIMDYKSTRFMLQQYELSYDGTVYRSGDITEDHIIAHLGDCLELTKSVCAKKEVLLEFDFQTASTSSYERKSPHLPVMFSRGSWFLKKLFSSQTTIRAYELDSSYRVVDCVSDRKCIYEFEIHEKSDIEYYEVKVDGTTLSSGSFRDDPGWRADGNYMVTKFQNVDCVTPMGAGAKAGIIAPCLAFLSLVVAFIIYRKRRKQAFDNYAEEDYEDPDQSIFPKSFDEEEDTIATMETNQKRQSKESSDTRPAPARSDLEDVKIQSSMKAFTSFING